MPIPNSYAAIPGEFPMPSKRLSTPPAHIPGVPPRPKGLERATRNAWNQLCEELAGKLFQDDSERLLELIQCRADPYRGASESKEAGRRRATALLGRLASREAVA